MKTEKSTFKRLMDNFLSLTALQGINYLVPLITFPYLVYTLGIEQFGLFSFIFAFADYGVTIVDYGFELAATKHISANQKNQKKIDEIFSSVMIIKTAMMILFFIFMLLLLTSVDKFSKDLWLYFLAFGLVIGEVLFPVWFFQGIEKMRYITILNALSKGIFAVAIFIFVHSPDDIDLVLMFYSLGSIIAGALAYYIATHKFGVTFSWQSKERLTYYLKDAWYIFTSRIATQLYQRLNIIILGFYVNDTLLGYYSIVIKIIRAGGAILTALPRALYPYFAKLYKESKEAFYYRNMQVTIGLFIVMAPISFLVYYFAPEILQLITGKTPQPLMVTLLHIYAPLLAVTIYGSQFTNILVILNETKLLNNIVVLAGIVNLLFIFVAIHYFSVVGLAWLTMFVVTAIIIAPKAYYIFFKFQKRDLAHKRD
jgi:PST family polysaccharide transporter